MAIPSATGATRTAPAAQPLPPAKPNANSLFARVEAIAQPAIINALRGQGVQGPITLHTAVLQQGKVVATAVTQAK